jgi:hypothetical protein
LIAGFGIGHANVAVFIIPPEKGWRSFALTGAFAEMVGVFYRVIIG